MSKKLKTINIAVVGLGYWGPNLVRNFSQIEGMNVVAVSDLLESNLQKIRLQYPQIKKLTTNYQDILDDSTIEAVAIATRVGTHFTLAASALKKGKDVLVEKPMTDSVSDARKLVALANKYKRVLMVDHTFIYSPPVQKIRDLIKTGEIGELMYIDSTRINLGLFQKDANVIWDLAPHDFSILEYILGRSPKSVSAVGVSHTKSKFEDIAYITLNYGGDLLAHISVNWISPVKVRRVVIGGTKKMIIYDDDNLPEKVKIYDKGFEFTKETPLNPVYRTGDIVSPFIKDNEPLRLELQHFADCIRERSKPLTNGEVGLKVVKLLEAANRSLKAGREVKL